jgi:hypothetical protein
MKTGLLYKRDGKSQGATIKEWKDCLDTKRKRMMKVDLTVKVDKLDETRQGRQEVDSGASVVSHSKPCQS